MRQWAQDVCNESIDFRDWKSETEPWLQGERSYDRSLILPGSALFQLTGPGLVTKRQENVYTRASAVYEEIFFRRMANMPEHSMEPKDVMRLALQVTNGNYGLAVLTVHYVFKATAYGGRATLADLNSKRNQLRNYILHNPNSPKLPYAIQRYQQEYRRGIARLQQFNYVVRPLKSLRADPSRIMDKMGPWYHIFALFAIDAYGGARQALLAGIAEHSAKGLKIFSGEGGFDSEKFSIDATFVFSQSRCRRALPDSLEEAYNDTFGTTHVCADSSVPATMEARYYRRMYGGGQTSYPVKQGKYICRNKSYSIVTRESITEYQCQSNDYRQCKIGNRIKVDEYIPHNDGSFTYEYNNKDNWVTFKPTKK